MNLKELAWGDVNWVYLAQFMVQCRGFVNTILKLTVP
jgi:hypothetical protein